MASLTLQFEDRVLKAYALGPITTIGRLPDNTVTIDSPTVSSHHACVFREGADFIVEDLQSTNGTFVNETRVVRQMLRHGDVVLVGKHKLVFDQLSVEGVTSHDGEPTLSNEGETVFLDAQQHQRLLAIVMNAEARGRSATGTPATLGVLRVLDGRADQEEYLLEGHTSLIGRARWTLVRLKGWFKPNVAVAITRNKQGYVATLLAGKMLVNNRPMKGRYDLKDGDILSVGGLTLSFGLRDHSSAIEPPSDEGVNQPSDKRAGPADLPLVYDTSRSAPPG